MNFKEANYFFDEINTIFEFHVHYRTKFQGLKFFIIHYDFFRETLFFRIKVLRICQAATIRLFHISHNLQEVSWKIVYWIQKFVNHPFFSNSIRNTKSNHKQHNQVSKCACVFSILRTFDITKGNFNSLSYLYYFIFQETLHFLNQISSLPSHHDS